MWSSSGDDVGLSQPAHATTSHQSAYWRRAIGAPANATATTSANCTLRPAAPDLSSLPSSFLPSSSLPASPFPAANTRNAKTVIVLYYYLLIITYLLLAFGKSASQGKVASLNRLSGKIKHLHTGIYCRIWCTKLTTPVCKSKEAINDKWKVTIETVQKAIAQWNKRSK